MGHTELPDVPNLPGPGGDGRLNCDSPRASAIDQEGVTSARRLNDQMCAELRSIHVSAAPDLARSCGFHPRGDDLRQRNGNCLVLVLAGQFDSEGQSCL